MNPKKLIKNILSVLLLAFVFSTANFYKLFETFSTININTVFFVLISYTIGQLFSSTKWWLIVQNAGIKVSYTQALRAYFIGMFVNCFGLGMVGGDIARGILISRDQPKKIQGLASVMVDRIHGLLVLGVIGCIAAFFFTALSHQYLYYTLLVFICVLLVALLFTPKLLHFVSSFLSNKLTDKLLAIADAFPRNVKTIVIITIISVVFHCWQIFTHSVMAAGIGVDISFATLFVVIPFVNIASSLPISWNGLGVRENSYIFFLTPQLLSKEQAVVFGALWLLSVTVASAIGGIIALVTGDLKMSTTN